MFGWLKQAVTTCWSKCTCKNVVAVTKQAASLLIGTINAAAVTALSAQSLHTFMTNLLEYSDPSGDRSEQKEALATYGLAVSFTICFVTIGVGTAHAFHRFAIEAITKKAPKSNKSLAWKRHGQLTAFMKGIQSGASIANMTTFFAASTTYGFRFYLAIISAVIGGSISLPQLYSYFSPSSASCIRPWFSAMMYSLPNAALQLHDLMSRVANEDDEATQAIYATLIALLGIIVSFDIYKTYRNINVRKKFNQDPQFADNSLTEEDVEKLIKEKFLQEGQMGLKKEVATVGTAAVSSAATGFQIYMDLQKILVKVGASEKPFYMLLALLLPISVLSAVLRGMRSYVTRVAWFLTNDPAASPQYSQIQEEDIEAGKAPDNPLTYPSSSPSHSTTSSPLLNGRSLPRYGALTE